MHSIQRLSRLPAVLALLALPASVRAQEEAPVDTTARPPAAAPDRTILAIGAHAGDMELTAGPVLIRHRRLGDRVVVLHLTLGEGGNPRLSPEAYGAQKREEALWVAEGLGVEVLFGPYADGEVPDDEAARHYVADVIRQVRPTHIITHWSNSIHKDHAAAHAITTDAVLLASLEGVASEHPRHRGVRGVYFAENWEDMHEFQPYVHVAVAEEDVVAWREAVRRYEFVGGDISTFRYLDYYDSLFSLRGALARRDRAVAFEVDPFGKRQVLDHFQ